jgi:hypothetical protein
MAENSQNRFRAVVLLAVGVGLFAITLFRWYNPHSWIVYFAHCIVAFSLAGAGVGTIYRNHTSWGAVIGAFIGVLYPTVIFVWYFSTVT